MDKDVDKMCVIKMYSTPHATKTPENNEVFSNESAGRLQYWLAV
jgi:hypothetical protein